MKRLEGKVAIVTGGASGIGEGIVKKFAENGAKVVIADLQDELGRALSSATGAFYHHTNVSNAQDHIDLVEATVKRFGRVDILVNNAGIIRDGSKIAEAAEDDFDATIAVDLKGVWLGIKYAVPALLASGGGSIINISSIAGLVGMNAQSAYGAAKGGVTQLTRHVAREYADRQIRVNCICPGGIVTPLSFKRRPEMSVEEVNSSFALRNPSKRTGRPEDIGYAAVWLGSDESGFVTGQVIAIDGGVTSTIYWQ